MRGIYAAPSLRREKDSNCRLRFNSSGRKSKIVSRDRVAPTEFIGRSEAAFSPSPLFFSLTSFLVNLCERTLRRRSSRRRLNASHRRNVGPRFHHPRNTNETRILRRGGGKTRRNATGTRCSCATCNELRVARGETKRI